MYNAWDVWDYSLLHFKNNEKKRGIKQFKKITATHTYIYCVSLYVELTVFRQHVGTAIQNDSSTTWPPQIGTTIQNDTLLPQIGFEVYNTFCWEPEVWTARWHNCSFYRWPYLYLLSYEKTQRYATTSRFCLYHLIDIEINLLSAAPLI